MVAPRNHFQEFRMATPSHGSNASTSANFDMRQAEDMWKNFNRIAKWMAVFTIILLICMAMFLTGHHAPLP
jgi:aa3 type cytochrome c oxidase subunit IV